MVEWSGTCEEEHTMRAYALLKMRGSEPTAAVNAAINSYQARISQNKYTILFIQSAVEVQKLSLEIASKMRAECVGAQEGPEAKKRMSRTSSKSNRRFSKEEIKYVCPGGDINRGMITHHMAFDGIGPHLLSTVLEKKNFRIACCHRMLDNIQ